MDSFGSLEQLSRRASKLTCTHLESEDGLIFSGLHLETDCIRFVWDYEGENGSGWICKERTGKKQKQITSQRKPEKASTNFMAILGLFSYFFVPPPPNHSPETIVKGSGMKMPLLVGGIFSKLIGSAGHSVPHCCGKQSQGCNQKSSGCDVLGSSKTKGCKASYRSTMSTCKFNKVTSTSRVFEMSTASNMSNITDL